SFINYDLPTEFIVYAHAAPAIKWVLDDIEELSLRTTDGMNIKFAYDNSVSWPYSWYFRSFPNAVFVGENPTLQNLEGAAAVVVGDDKRSKVEPLLEDQYIRFDHMRLWWPMQDYFGLNPSRVLNTLDFSGSNPQASQIREGIFDIWWSRDYRTYGTAVQKDFSLENWPVADIMHFYVRKDIAQQVWPYGTGDGTVFTSEPEPVNLCRVNWLQDKQATMIFEAPASQPLNRPLGIDVDPAGNLYVAEEYGHRISIFDASGQFVRSLGTQGTDPGLVFNRPNSVKVSDQGFLYVADTWNYRITRLSPQGEVVAQWGQPYTMGFEAVPLPEDGFWGPRDVSLDAGGLVYVSDTGNKRVRVYRVDDGTAIYQRDIGRGGSGQGELDEPNAVVIHPVDGRIFVADTWNRRVSVFSRDGAFLTSFPVRAWYNRESGSLPYLALDAAREMLYVGDPDAGRVLVFNTAGECLGSFGSPTAEAATDSSFTVVSGLALDDAGNVYVADAALNRVLKFTSFAMPGILTDAGAPAGDGGPGTGPEATAEVTAEVTAPVDSTE
nr:NHL repeat-containing protein [Anaerolineae bacterium]